MNNLKKKLEKAHINYKVELTTIVLINLVFIIFLLVVFLFLKNVLYIFPILILMIISNVLYVYYLNNKINQKLCFQDHEVTMLLSHYHFAINNGVESIKALESLKENATIHQAENIDSLIKDIQHDKSISPYLKFSNNYQSPFIHQAITCLYAFTKSNNQNCKEEFNKSFVALKSDDNSNYLNNSIKPIKLFNILPVIGTAIVMIFLIVIVIFMMGGFING